MVHYQPTGKTFKNQYVIKFLRRLEERNSHVGDIKILKWSLMCMFTTANFKSQFSQHDFFSNKRFNTVQRVASFLLPTFNEHRMVVCDFQLFQ